MKLKELQGYAAKHAERLSSISNEIEMKKNELSDLTNEIERAIANADNSNYQELLNKKSLLEANIEANVDFIEKAKVKCNPFFTNDDVIKGYMEELADYEKKTQKNREKLLKLFKDVNDIYTEMFSDFKEIDKRHFEYGNYLFDPIYHQRYYRELGELKMIKLDMELKPLFDMNNSQSN